MGQRGGVEERTGRRTWKQIKNSDIGYDKMEECRHLLRSVMRQLIFLVQIIRSAIKTTALVSRRDCGYGMVVSRKGCHGQQ